MCRTISWLRNLSIQNFNQKSGVKTPDFNILNLFMKKIVDFYKNLLGFDEFYNIALYNSTKDKNEYIQNIEYLNGIKKGINITSNNNEIIAIQGEYRIDVPVWFGDMRIAKNRIIVFGLEPRDTNPDFNIEKIGNKIFASPFGVDRWNVFSSVKRKPQNRYFRVFKELIDNKENFVLFSDIVKDYQIFSNINENRKNDLNARALFFSKAEKELEHLTEEINNIKPTHIITLGNDSFTFLSKYYPHITHRLRHPANGGETKAKEMLKKII